MEFKFVGMDAGTMDMGSIANQELPEVIYLDDVRTRKSHFRNGSHDLKLDLIEDPEVEFSKSLVEQV